MISADQIESEFRRFLESMALDVRLDTTRMSVVDARSFAETKLVLTTAMANGVLSINEAGEPVFAPKGDATPITFHEATGADVAVMDHARTPIDKQHRLLAAITKEPRARFEKLAMRDYRVCVALLILMVFS